MFTRLPQLRAWDMHLCIHRWRTLPFGSPARNALAHFLLVFETRRPAVFAAVKKFITRFGHKCVILIFALISFEPRALEYFYILWYKSISTLYYFFSKLHIL